MALNFKKYESTATTLETIGTVASQIPGGSLKFVPGTFTSGKRIAIILTNKAGESTVLACSKRVSATLRSALENGSTKKDLLAAIVKLEISEDEEGRNFIMAPQGVGGQEEELNISVATKQKVSYEDLIAF